MREPATRLDPLERVLEAILHPVLALDARGRIARANLPARRLWGRELEGADLKALFDPLPEELREAELSRLGSLPEGRRVECRARTPQGPRPVRLCLAAFKEERRAAGFLLEVEDLSEQRRQQELAEWKAIELARSNAELEQFAYAASHDLQEPLRKILLFGELLSRAGDKLDGQTRDFIERMRKAAGRMSALIEGLLAYSRVSTHARAFQKVDLGELVADVVADFDILATMAGAVVTVGRLPAVEGDELQLRRLFQNLVGNALKFRRLEVPLAIDIEAKDLGDGFVEISVADNGVGFEPSLASRLFKPFQRLHADREGTGMGLAICHRIAVRHGGKISVTSAPGRGTRFAVSLPRRSDQWKSKS